MGLGFTLGEKQHKVKEQRQFISGRLYDKYLCSEFMPGLLYMPASLDVPTTLCARACASVCARFHVYALYPVLAFMCPLSGARSRVPAVQASRGMGGVHIQRLLA